MPEPSRTIITDKDTLEERKQATVLLQRRNTPFLRLDLFTRASHQYINPFPFFLRL